MILRVRCRQQGKPLIDFSFSSKTSVGSLGSDRWTLADISVPKCTDCVSEVAVSCATISVIVGYSRYDAESKRKSEDSREETITALADASSRNAKFAFKRSS